MRALTLDVARPPTPWPQAALAATANGFPFPEDVARLEAADGERTRWPAQRAGPAARAARETHGRGLRALSESMLEDELRRTWCS